MTKVYLFEKLDRLLNSTIDNLAIIIFAFSIVIAVTVLGLNLDEVIAAMQAGCDNSE